MRISGCIVWVRLVLRRHPSAAALLTVGPGRWWLQTLVLDRCAAFVQFQLAQGSCSYPEHLKQRTRSLRRVCGHACAGTVWHPGLACVQTLPMSSSLKLLREWNICYYHKKFLVSNSGPVSEKGCSSILFSAFPNEYFQLSCFRKGRQWKIKKILHKAILQFLIILLKCVQPAWKRWIHVFKSRSICISKLRKAILESLF